MSRIRILPTISALILTFAILFGGFQVYKNYELVRPLVAQLRQIPSVLSVQVATTGQSPAVYLKLGPVSDLQTTYSTISTDVTNTLGTPVGIYLQDKSTPYLRNLYEFMQPTLRQDIAQSEYTRMIADLDQMAARDGVKARVTMNAQDIFIQLAKGNAYLYAIVSYATKSSGVSVQ
ncbi:MAG: hypothetical protein OWT28_10145 [Firmicutes bacterium]|nr:hypothetical protein [Bacillota bacterium]